MSKSLRLFLFLLFVFAFLISAPIVVLYTAGYRFDLSHGRIVHTAVLNITSDPHNANILVDNITTQEKTPAVLVTILPGEHLIGIHKDGYLQWETKLTFENRSALVLGPIILFLDAQPQLRQNIPTIVTAVHKETNRFAYATHGSSWLEVWVMNATTAEIKLLMQLPYVTKNSYTLNWSTNGTYLALTENIEGQKNTFITRVEDGKAIELPKETLNMEDVWWDVEQDARLYIKTSTELIQIDLNQEIKNEFLPFSAQHLTTKDNRIVTLSESGNRNVVSYQDGETASIITYLTLGDYVFVEAPNNIIALEDTRHNRLILLDPENREQPILLNEEAKLWTWNASEDVLLYSSGYDIKQYNRSAHETQTITRLSTPIEWIDWYPRGNSIIYQTNGELNAINLHETTILSQTTIFTKANGTFWLDPDGKNVSALVKTETGFEWWTRALQN